MEAGRVPPLRKMISAAYGVTGRLGGKRAPRGLPGKAFFVTSLASGGMLGEESHARHVPSEKAPSIISSLRSSCSSRFNRLLSAVSTGYPLLLIFSASRRYCSSVL